jgi:ADP-ribose pyrophosphatase YjhB (NUDIX family)
MPRVRDAYCSYCGTRFPEPLRYPRTCPACSVQIWANPIPVSVVLVQIVDDRGLPPGGSLAEGRRGLINGDRTGLLVIRRAIPPAVGKLALVGGFLEDHESWQHGGAREVREETGVTVDPAQLAPHWFASSEPNPNRVLLFGLAPPQPASALPPFQGDAESSERGVIYGPGGLDEVFAFSTHIEAARRYFTSRGLTNPHGFTPR